MSIDTLNSNISVSPVPYLPIMGNNGKTLSNNKTKVLPTITKQFSSKNKNLANFIMQN